MMQQKDKSAGGLVPLKEAAEDRTPAPVRVDGRELALSVRNKFSAVVKGEIDRSELGAMAVQQVFCYGSFIVMCATLGSVGAGLGSMFFMPALLSGGFYSSVVQARATRLAGVAEETESDLRQNLRVKQRVAYRNKEERLVELADAHLKEGGFLDEKTLSYLVAIPEERLRKASDRLAITVLQARRMLAYERGGRRDEALRPTTFASFQLIPGRTLHGVLLRGKLGETATRLAEDEGPEAPAPEVMWPEHIPEIESLKISKLGSMLRTIAAPLFVFADRRRLREVENVALPDTVRAESQVPALRPAAGFSEALARYERDVERLDLPALRGRGGVSGGGPLLPGRVVPVSRL